MVVRSGFCPGGFGGGWGPVWWHYEGASQVPPNTLWGASFPAEYMLGSAVASPGARIPCTVNPASWPRVAEQITRGQYGWCSPLAEGRELMGNMGDLLCPGPSGDPGLKLAAGKEAEP